MSNDSSLKKDGLEQNGPIVDRRSCQRRGGPGRRLDDPIADLKTHPAKHVSARQVAQYCEVSLQTVYKWIDCGTLKRDFGFTREIRISTDQFRLFVLRMRRVS
jgi:predicted DNA-binding transcriptional regulator AlpA